MDEVDGDLRVLDPPGSAGVLALDPSGALLHVPRSRRPPAPRPRRADAPARTHARHHARGRHPTWPGRAGAACRPDSSPRPTRRSTSSSCAAGPTAARVPSPSPGAGAPPARTGPLSGPSGSRTPPASGQGLRCDPRPPQDLQSSHTDDQRWPYPSISRPVLSAPSGCGRAPRRTSDSSRKRGRNPSPGHSEHQRDHTPLTCAYAPLRYSGAIVRCTSDVPSRASCYRVRICHTLHA